MRKAWRKLNELKNSIAALLAKEERRPPLRTQGGQGHAQILMTILSAEALEEAKRIIEEFGIYVLETKLIAPNKALFRLNAMDMREVVLKLTESGFSGLKGINALAFQKRR